MGRGVATGAVMVLTVFWLFGMMALRGTLWLPWLALLAAIAISSLALPGSGGQA